MASSLLGNLNLGFLQKLFSKFLPSNKEDNKAKNDQPVFYSDKFSSLESAPSSITSNFVVAQGTSVGEINPDRLKKIVSSDIPPIYPPKINPDNVQKAEEELKMLVNSFPISGKGMSGIPLEGQKWIYDFILNYSQNITQYYSNVGDDSNVQKLLEISKLYNPGYDRGLGAMDSQPIQAKIGNLTPQELLKLVNNLPSEIKPPQITPNNIAQAETGFNEIINSFPGNKTKLDGEIHPEKRARIYKFISDLAKSLLLYYEASGNKKQSQRLQQIADRYAILPELSLVIREESRGITA